MPQLQVYGAWIVTLFQLSATFECAECLSIERKGQDKPLVVVQCEKNREAHLDSTVLDYFYSSLQQLAD